MLFEQVLWLMVIMVSLRIGVRSFFAYRDKGFLAKLYMSAHQDDCKAIRLSAFIYGVLTAEAEDVMGEALASSTGKGKDEAFEMFGIVVAGWKSIESQIAARMVADDIPNVPLRWSDKWVIASRHKELRKLRREAIRVSSYLSILQVADAYPPAKRA
jgi:hypothetical protein